MNQESIEIIGSRRTTAEEVFNLLRADIESLRLTPGTKLSEADVAKRYNVSRQPVREAFIRLDHIALLKVQPQKATIVKRISKSDIVQSRFVRLSVEVEAARIACRNYRGEKNDKIQEVLDQQNKCITEDNTRLLNKLDYTFHKLICEAAGCDFAFEVIQSCKTTVDRLCTLELSNECGARQVYSDHLAIFSSLKANDESAMVEATRKHLSRLDETIDVAQKKYSDYFED